MRQRNGAGAGREGRVRTPRPRSAEPGGESWSKGKPPARAPTAEDWERAPRLCSLAWVAWLVGMPGSTFSDLMSRDTQLRDRLSYRSPTGGYRWYFSVRVWEWVDGRQWKGLRIMPSAPDPP